MNKNAEKKVGKSFEELSVDEMNNIQGSYLGISWQSSSSSLSSSSSYYSSRCSYYSSRCSYGCYSCCW